MTATYFHLQTYRDNESCSHPISWHPRSPLLSLWRPVNLQSRRMGPLGALPDPFLLSLNTPSASAAAQQACTEISTGQKCQNVFSKFHLYKQCSNNMHRFPQDKNNNMCLVSTTFINNVSNILYIPGYPCAYYILPRNKFQ